MRIKENLFRDDADSRFIIERMIDWTTLISLLEDDFKSDPERPFDTAEEAKEFFLEVLQLAGEICGTSIAPRAEAMDRDQNKFEGGKLEVNRDLLASIHEIAESGLMCLSTERKYGGQNFPAVISMVLHALVAQADAATMICYGLNEGVAETIERFGSEELKLEWIPGLASGEVIGAMALTEPEAGSDLGMIRTHAYQKNGNWFLKGKKSFISNGFDLNLVLARSTMEAFGTTRGLSLYLCPKSDQVEVISLEHKMGIRGSPTCELNFDDAPCFLIGEEGNGFKMMLTLMNAARVGVGAQSLGLARAAYLEALSYAEERIQGGGPIIEHALIRDLLVRMQTDLEAMRILVLRTAEWSDFARGYERKLNRMEPGSEGYEEIRRLAERYAWQFRMLVPLTKFWCSERCVEITSNAIQIFGGNGYVVDYPVERLFRDARVTPIYEGTNEIQYMMAMKDMMGQKFSFVLDEIGHYAESRKMTASSAEDDEGEGLTNDFEYSMAAFGGYDEESESKVSLYDLLLEARDKLVDATQYLITTLAEMGDDHYARMQSKSLAEMAVYLFVGYEFLRQGEQSNRKKKLAEKWIREKVPMIRVLHERITSGERSTLDMFREFIYLQGDN